MDLIGIVSFLIGIISLLISVYIHALSKKNIKGLRYYEIWRNRQESYFVIFNRSELHITRRDVYKNIFIDLRDEKAKLFSYKVKKPFGKSKVEFHRVGNQIHLDIDYIYPRRFALVIIKSNSESYFTLEGILNDGKIIKYRYKIMRFWYHPLTRFAVYLFFSLILFLTILFSLIFYDNFEDDTKTTSFLQIASYIISVLMGSAFCGYYETMKGIDLNTYKEINRIVRKREREERIRRNTIRKEYLSRKIKRLKENLIRRNTIRKEYLSRKIKRLKENLLKKVDSLLKELRTQRVRPHKS